MKNAHPSLRLATAGLLVLGGSLAHIAFADDTANNTANSMSGTQSMTDTSRNTDVGQSAGQSAGQAATTPDSATTTQQTTTQTTTQAIPTEVKIQDLNKNPQKFAGQDVMVKGKINKIEGAGAFILEGSGLLNNKILVVVAKNEQAGISGQQPGTKAPVIKEKAKVQLTGKIEQIDLTKIEEKYQPGLKAEIKAEFEGSMPVLIVSPEGFKKLS